MSLPIITIDFTLDGKTMDVLYKNPDELTAGVASEMGKLGRAVASKAAKMMRQWLAPGHQYGVGVTGKASQNVFAERAGTYNGVDAWAVVEGGLTPANQYIRFGRSAGSFPDVGKLSAWVALKAMSGDIKIKLDTGKSMRFIKKKTGSGRSRPWKQHRSRYKGKDNVYKSVAFLIGRKLKTSGGNYSHIDLHPPGQPRFDYVSYAITRNKERLLKIIELGYNDVFAVLLNYIQTGKYSGRIRQIYGD